MDEVRPNWAEKIDLNIFNISSGCDCVLGQVYGEYSNGARFLKKKRGLDMNDRFRHGFIATGRQDERDLDKAWIHEIETRLEDTD